METVLFGFYHFDTDIDINVGTLMALSVSIVFNLVPINRRKFDNIVV